MHLENTQFSYMYCTVLTVHFNNYVYKKRNLNIDFSLCAVDDKSNVRTVQPLPNNRRFQPALFFNLVSGF
jgi:hypothetical protein